MNADELAHLLKLLARMDGFDFDKSKFGDVNIKLNATVQKNSDHLTDDDCGKMYAFACIFSSFSRKIKLIQFVSPQN